MQIRTMAALSAGVLCLTASVQHALAAEDSAFGLGAGINYSSGDYGTSTTTRILSVPVTARYDRGPLTLKLTVPWIRITGSNTVVPGVGQVRNTNPRGRGRGQVVGGVPVITTTESSESGLGDIVAAATYNAYYDTASKFGLDLTGKVKFGTADRDKGLGTGEDDYGAQVDVYKTFDRVTLFAGLGYTFLGSSEFIQLDDVWNLSLGGSYRLDDRDSVGLSLDMRERSSPSSFEQREVSVYWVHKIDRAWKAQAYVLKGLKDGSPDWGAGAFVGYTF